MNNWFRALIFLATVNSAAAQNIEVKQLSEKETRDLDMTISGKNVIRAYEVRDRSGYTDVVISKTEIGSFGSGGFSCGIFGYAGLNDHGGYLDQWRFKQFNQSVLEGIDFKTVKVAVKDMDKDGYAEYYILYDTYVDGLDPDTWKLLVYNRNKKYVKRFYAIKQPEDEGKKPEADAAWKDLPQAIKQYADGLFKSMKQ